MKKYIYWHILTPLRDSVGCPEWLADRIDDIRYSKLFESEWNHRL